MRYLLDTNMVTSYLEGRPQVVERLEHTRPRDRYLCFITLVTNDEKDFQRIEGVKMENWLR